VTHGVYQRWKSERDRGGSSRDTSGGALLGMWQYFRGGERAVAQGEWGRRGVVGCVGGRGQSVLGVFLYIPEGLNVRIMFWGTSQWWLKERGGKAVRRQC